MVSEMIGIFGAVLAFILAPLLGLVAWTFTSFRSEANRAIEELRKENREQALLIAGIKAGEHDARMVALLEKLDDKIDGLGRGFDRFTTIVERLERKFSTSAGEYASVPRPRREP